MEYTSPLQDDARGGPLGEEPHRLGRKQGQATMGPLGGDSGKETFGSPPFDVKKGGVCWALNCCPLMPLTLLVLVFSNPFLSCRISWAVSVG